MAGEQTVQPGDSGEWVTYLQRQLGIWDHVNAVPETGTFDEATEAKLREFQEVNLGSATGVCDEHTWSTLLAITQPGGGAAAAADGPVRVDIHDSHTFDGRLLTMWIGGAEQALKKDSQGFDAEILSPDGSVFWGRGGIGWPDNDLAAGEWAEYHHTFEGAPPAGQGYKYNLFINLGKDVQAKRELLFDVGADSHITFR